MAEKILIVLSRHGQADEITPCIDTLAKPGLTMVFLVPYPVESRDYLRDHWMTTESTKVAMLGGRRINERYSWNAQRELAEQKLADVCTVMGEKGVMVEIELYTGTLRSVVRKYACDEKIRLIIIPERSGFLQRAAVSFRLTKPARSIPVAFLATKV